MADTLSVRYRQFLVGTIEASDDGPMLQYDSRWENTRGAFSISLSMPLGGGPYGASTLMPWLMNLLPEATALNTVARYIGVAPGDAIGLLQRIGADTAGALTFGDYSFDRPAAVRPVPTASDLERIIEELPEKPFLISDDGVSMSLAGVQEKLPVAAADGAIGIPINGMPSTHILKPDHQQRLFGSVHNEALCAVLARRCGLNGIQVTTGIAGERRYLLVTRYDRAITDNRIRRIHQEDFCQALGLPPSSKYGSNQTGQKGPGIAELLQLAERYLGATGKLDLFRAIVFNVLICNTDSHAKNYSMILNASGPELAPLYDMMCAACWENITRNLPQKIADKNRGDHIYGRHWQRMADAAGLNRTATLREVGRLADRVVSKIDAAMAEVEAMPAGGHPMLSEFKHAIVARCRTVKANLAETEAT